MLNCVDIGFCTTFFGEDIGNKSTHHCVCVWAFVCAMVIYYIFGQHQLIATWRCWVLLLFWSFFCLYFLHSSIIPSPPPDTWFILKAVEIKIGNKCVNSAHVCQRATWKQDVSYVIVMSSIENNEFCDSECC